MLREGVLVDVIPRGQLEEAEAFYRRVEDLLDKMNVPSKADIDALSAKITALSHKIDDLKQSKKVAA